MGIKIVRLLVQALLAPSMILAMPGVAEAKQSTTINQKENVEIYTSVGDLLVKVTLKEGLPNALGGSDIFGRKRERGFVELRFMGMAPDGRAIFRRKSVDIVSNETTLSPSQSLSGGQATVVQRGSGTNVAIIGRRGGDATVETLPADTIDFALDLSKHRIITIEDRIIEIVQADPGGVSFKLSRRSN